MFEKQSLQADEKGKFKITTHSKHNLKISPDLVKREFNPSKPNRIWVTRDGWLYLCVILDLFSRREQIAGFFSDFSFGPGCPICQ